MTLNFFRLATVLKFTLVCSFIFSSAMAEEKNEYMNDVFDDLKRVQGDEKANEINALKAELLIRRSEKKAMKQINKLLRQYKGSGMEAGLLFRKAELFMRKSKTARFFEVSRESATVVKLAPKVVKKESAKRNILEAINIYDQIQRKHPHFRDMDLVLFNNGFARQQIGKNDIAKKLYAKIINEYQDSPLVPDAHLAMGEILFDEKKFSEARRAYENIKKYPSARVYPYGRYKLAWALYNLEKFETALLELEAVVAYSNKVEANEDDNRLSLKTEALRDMVLFYSEHKPAAGAVDYFVAQAGEEEAGQYVLRLSRIYNRHSKNKEEVIALNQLIAQLPLTKFVPKAHLYLIEGYEHRKLRNKVVSELVALNNLCSDNSSWNKKFIELAEKAKQSKQEFEFPKCQQSLNIVAANMAVKWHKIWKLNKHKDQLGLNAEKAYEIYLSRNLKSKKAIKMRNLYADLLFLRTKYDLASDQYFIVAQNATDKNIIHDTSYSSIFSLQKAVGDKKWNQKQELRYVELASFYILKNPKGKFIEAVEFKRAFIIFDNKRYAEAAPLLKDLGQKYRLKEQGVKAQDLYLEILNMNKDFVGIKEYTSLLLSWKPKGKRKDTLTKLYQESYFASIQQQEKSNSSAALEEYLKFAKANMDSPLADKSWWNAVQLAKKENDLVRVANLSYDLYKKFPKSNFKLEALKLSTQVYEKTGRLQEASEVLVKLSKEDPKNAATWNKLAADFQYITGNTKNALSFYSKILEKANSKDKRWALRKLIEHEKAYEPKSSKYKSLSMNYNLQPEASFYLAELSEQQFDKKQYSAAFKNASKVIGMKGQSSNFAKARARYVQALVLEKEFKQQSVKSSRPDKIAIVLAIKTEKLEKAQKAFNSAAQYGDAEVAVKSFRRLATCYGHYSKALRSMRLPDNIPKEDAQAFYNELESLAIPMEEREVDTLVSALKYAKRAGIRDGSISEIQVDLDRLNMTSSKQLSVTLENPDYALPKIVRVEP